MVNLNHHGRWNDAWHQLGLRPDSDEQRPYKEASMRCVRFLIFPAAVALFCAGDLLAAQRTFVSAANGSDSNPCTPIILPCRSFAAAILQTGPDGEVIVLDSGGYGAVTISQSVSIISPSGVYAGMTGFVDNAVTVSAGDTAHVVLRNLSLTSQGATVGIDANTVATLNVENCVINGFGTYGILFDPTTPNARLYVSNTVIRRSGATGIYVTGGTVRATLDSVRLHGNYAGVFVQGSDVTIRKSVASGGGNQGFWADSFSHVTIEDSVSTSNAYGFYANGGGVMSIARCAATSNTLAGVKAYFSPSVIYVSDSTIAANFVGVATFSGGVVNSRGINDVDLRGNNTLQANTTDGAFTAVVPAN